MNYLKPLLAVLLLLASLSRSVAQSADPLTYIPQEAQNIYVVNLPSLVSKMDLNAIKNLDFMKEALNKANDKQAADFLKNPAESGINFLNPMVITMMQFDSSSYQSLAVIIPLTDATKFGKMMAMGIHPIVHKNDRYIIETDTSVLAWNDQMFVAMTLKKGQNMPSMPATLTDSISMDSTEMAVIATDSMNVDSSQMAVVETDSSETRVIETDSTGMNSTGLTAIMPAEKLPKLDPSVYFQNSEVNSKTAALRELMRIKHDFYIYQTTDGASKNMKGAMASLFLGLKPTDLDGNITSGWVDFERGRIVGEMTQKMNDAMNQKFKNLGRVRPTVDWNQYINAKNVPKTIATLSFSFNPLGFKEMLADNMLMKMSAAKMAATKSKNKFSMDKATMMFGGDLFVTLAGTEKDMSLLAGISIADKKGFEKLLKKDLKIKKVSRNLFRLNTKKPVVTEDAGPQMPFKSKEPMFILLKDNVALMGEKSQIMALNTLPKLLPTALKAEMTDWQKSLKNKPFNFYFDLKNAASFLGQKGKEELEDMPLEGISIGLANKVTNFEIKMVDKDKNALTAFLFFSDKLAKKKNEKKRILENPLDDVDRPKKAGQKDNGN